MITVIVYDDNLQRCKSLEALISLDNNIHYAGGFFDCSTIIKNIDELVPDIILMDIEMPKIDGITAVKMVKQHNPLIRIIMQTVFDDNDKVFNAIKAGAEGYILKSTQGVKILESIHDVYNGGAFMTPSIAFQVMKYFNVEKLGPDYKLTQKETEVLKHLSEGKSYKMVADQMHISYFTVNSHIKKIYEKLHVHSLGEAVSLAIKNKIV